MTRQGTILLMVDAAPKTPPGPQRSESLSPPQRMQRQLTITLGVPNITLVKFCVILPLHSTCGLEADIETYIIPQCLVGLDPKP